MTSRALDLVNTSEWIQAVESAGAATMPFFRQTQSDLAIRFKDDRSPVTAGDLASHQTLIDLLWELTPEWPVISEELMDPTRLKPPTGPYWLIDPLDGTREFISGSGEFTINLALIWNQVSIWGCVHAPALDQTYWGGHGTGAYLRSAGVTRGIRVRPANANGLIVLASKSHLDARTAAFIERLGTCQFTQAGSSLKFCRIAEGEADIYPRLAPTCEWDTAAAQAVLEAAGGFVHDLHGQPLRYGKSNIINPFFVASRPGVAWTA